MHCCHVLDHPVGLPQAGACGYYYSCHWDPDEVTSVTYTMETARRPMFQGKQD